MITIDQTIEEEKSVIKKKINRKTLINIKQYSPQHEVVSHLRTHTNQRFLKDKSQQSIKQKSLEDTEFKKIHKDFSACKKPENKAKPNKETVKRPSPSPNYSMGINYTNTSSANHNSKTMCKDYFFKIGKEFNPHKKASTKVLKTAYQKDSSQPKQSKKMSSRSRSSKQNAYSQHEEKVANPIENKFAKTQSSKKSSKKKLKRNKDQSVIYGQMASYEFPRRGPNTMAASNFEVTRNRIMCPPKILSIDISMNEEIFRVFEQTESKMMEDEDMTMQECEALEQIYSTLSKISLQDDQIDSIENIVRLGNRLRSHLRHFKIWKWLLIAMLLLILKQRRKESDEQWVLNRTNLCTYLKMNFLLHIENLLDIYKVPLKVNVFNFIAWMVLYIFQIVSKLRSLTKKPLKQIERHQKISKNSEIVKSIVNLILSGLGEEEHKIQRLIEETRDCKFYSSFFQHWRSLNVSPLLPPIDKKYTHTLCLDLDETLICYSEKDKKMQVRPHLNQFIETLSQYFELVIFTSAVKEYADFMVDEIDPKRLIVYRLYRQHCSSFEKQQVKDLSRLGRDLNKTYLVDNLKYNYRLQPSSGILIQSWYGDPKDHALLDVMHNLLKLVTVDCGQQTLKKSRAEITESQSLAEYTK